MASGLAALAVAINTGENGVITHSFTEEFLENGVVPLDSGNITKLLVDVNDGRPGAWDVLMAAAYDELRAGAGRLMQQEVRAGGPGDTLQPTAVVHEAFIRLIKDGLEYDKRGHFFVAFSTRMMEVLLDHIRARKTQKRGGGFIRVPLDPDARSPERIEDSADISALNTALKKLEAFDSRKANVVKLRIMCGLTIAEAAESLGVGHATVERDWRFSKAWLAAEFAGGK